MFGPVDWDHDRLSEVSEGTMPEAESVAPGSQLDDEEYIIVWNDKHSLYSAQDGENATTAMSKGNAKSSFDRETPLCEANMFGPLDWALPLMGGDANLELGT